MFETIPANLLSIALPIGGAFQEVVASAPWDLCIVGLGAQGQSNRTRISIGVGPSGSEVVREYVWVSQNSGEGHFAPCPYGVMVRQGERVALSFNNLGSFSGTMIVACHTVRLSSVRSIPEIAQYTAGTVTGSAWQQLWNGAPLTGNKGGWIYAIALTCTSGTTPQQVRLGFGTSGSEQAVSGWYTTPSAPTSGYPQYAIPIAPIWWPPGARLAAQGNYSLRNAQIEVLVRESL